MPLNFQPIYQTRRGWSRRGSQPSQGDMVNAMLNEYQSGQRSAQQQYDTVNQGYGSLISQNAGKSAQITQGYQDRLNRGMSLLQGYGDVARADIGRTWQRQAAAADQGLTNRGLGNTTIRSNMQRGMAAGEMQDVARLRESLRGQKMNYYSQLSGDSLAAQQNQQNVGNNLALQQLNFQGNTRFETPSLMDIAGYQAALQGARMQALSFLPAYSGRRKHAANGYIWSQKVPTNKYQMAMRYLE